MALQNFSCQAGLQRRKTKPIAAIAFQDEPDEPVTKAANAVVEDDGVGIRHGVEVRIQNAEFKSKAVLFNFCILTSAF